METQSECFKISKNVQEEKKNIGENQSNRLNFVIRNFEDFMKN